MSKMPWFRTYTRMVDDDKLKLLAFEDRWHFVALLCLKGEGLLDKDDSPTLRMRKVAVKMGLDVRTLEEVARRLAEVGLIDQDTLQPIKWEGLQMRSDTDPTAAERKRRQRERSKPSGHAGDTDMSRVTVTDVTRTDTDKEEEKEETVVADIESRGGKPASDAPPAATPRAKTPTATRLSAEWALPKAWGEWALQERPDMTAEDVRREAACFADHWHAKAGSDARKADWQATWRNWIRRCHGPAPTARASPRGGHGQFVSKQEQIEEHNRAVAARVIQRMQEGQAV